MLSAAEATAQACASDKWRPLIKERNSDKNSPLTLFKQQK
jgi:hypothetical protein